MGNLSTTDTTFAENAARVLCKTGEIACVIRFSHAAGNRSFEFFENINSFKNRLLDLPPKTSVVLFHEKQFPIRGVVDEALLNRAIVTLPDGEYWTLTRTSLITEGNQSWYHVIDGNSLAELENELRDSWFWGHPVALGPEPDWHDLERTEEAIVPSENGEVLRGIY